MTSLGRLLCLLAVLPWSIPLAARAAIGDLQVEYAQTAQRRVSRTVFEYTFSVSARNQGSVECLGVAALITSNIPSTVIMSGDLSFGDLPPGAVGASTQPLTFQQDRQVPFDPVNLLAAFSATNPECASGEEIGRLVQYELPPASNLSDPSLPGRLPNGNLFVYEVPGAQLQLDPNLRDPITAYGGCLDWVSFCVSPPDRDFDDCARSAPTCGTDTPWLEEAECCPAACFEQYAARRRSGASPLQSFGEVYGKGATCFPGLAN